MDATKMAVRPRNPGAEGFVRKRVIGASKADTNLTLDELHDFSSTYSLPWRVNPSAHVSTWHTRRRKALPGRWRYHSHIRAVAGPWPSRPPVRHRVSAGGSTR